MLINHYNECNEIFWNEESFNYSLEEKHIWDMDKYWKLEYFLIKLCESLVGAETLNRELAANLYYLANSINRSISSHNDPEDYFILENYNQHEADDCVDRLNHIMRILWGRIPFTYDYLIVANPLIQKDMTNNIYQ